MKDDCTEPNRKACPRLCQDFCSKAEIERERIMPMTLEEMKLAVCANLPDVLAKAPFNDSTVFYWKNCAGEYDIESILDHTIYWPTEGLQVCHEARALFSLAERVDYLNAMRRVILAKRLKTVSDFDVAQASQSEQLEGISRVWWPKMFE